MSESIVLRKRAFLKSASALALTSGLGLVGCGGGASETAVSEQATTATPQAPAPSPGTPATTAPPPPAPSGGGPINARHALRALDLGVAGPYVSSVELVDTGEESTYNRKDTLALFMTRELRGWGWQFAQKQAPGTLPRMRLMVDGEVAAGWKAADADGIYRFDVTVANGHHIGYVQAEGMGIRCFGVPFIVNDTGRPLLQQRPWTATKRFDANQGMACVAVQAEYVEQTPVTRPLRNRVVKTYRHRVSKSDLWGRHYTANVDRPMTRRWAMSPSGDMLIEVDQKYFHSDAIDNHDKPRRNPVLALYDGPRGVGTLGYVCDMRIRADAADGGSNSLYFLETSGRLGRLRFADGDILTELGPKLKAGRRKVHSQVLDTKYLHYRDQPTYKAHQEVYHGQWEQFGDWSQVVGPHGLWEPWGFALAMRKSDGSMTVRDGHEFWIADTRHHRIVYADHWTAHSQAGFQRAHYPPPWYVQSNGPTGTTTVANFVGSRDGSATEACNEPWQCKINPFDGLLYWTNFQGNSIYRCRLDGSGTERVLKCALDPTDADLNVPTRLDQSSTDPIDLRKRWVVDGGPGVASCVHPTAFDFDSKGRLVFVEHYTYAIRRLDLATRQVTTLCAVLDVNGGSASSGNNEPVLVVDSQGTCGPVDDIFVQAWSNNTDRRFDCNGVPAEWANQRALATSIFFNGGSGQMPHGPGHLLFHPNYAWGLDVWGGRIIGAGNAAGSQFIELTLAQPDDPVPDATRWRRGREAYLASGLGPTILGSDGQGELGFPTFEAMATWSARDIADELLGLGVSSAAIDDAVYYVQWGGSDNA
jgi:hypothetical protein